MKTVAATLQVARSPENTSTHNLNPPRVRSNRVNSKRTTILALALAASTSLAMAQADVATPCRGGSYCYAGGTSDAGYGRHIEYPGVFTFSGGGRTNLSAGGGNYSSGGYNCTGGYGIGGGGSSPTSDCDYGFLRTEVSAFEPWLKARALLPHGPTVGGSSNCLEVMCETRPGRLCRRPGASATASFGKTKQPGGR